MIRSATPRSVKRREPSPAILELERIATLALEQSAQDALDLANRTGTACWVYVDGKLTNIANSGKVAAKKAAKKTARKVAPPTAAASRKASAATAPKPAKTGKPSAARKR